MINKRIKITGMEMTPSISEYVHKKIDALTKFIEEKTQALAEIEIGRTTQHHHKGDVYKADINLTFDGNTYKASIVESDLYTAIDMMKDRILQDISTGKDKKISLFKKGQQRLKSLLKGKF